jgi:1-acyl-sn-glycerol-3-phosphate acyltransferase
VKSAVLRLVRLLVGLFFRRIEVTGLDNVPREGSVLFVANHSNGLVDPMLVLRALPRPVVFVAKSTLWRIPLLRLLLDLLGCVPVVRRKEAAEEGDAKGEERNRASFEILAEVLGKGGTILIFPEGRSHSDPLARAFSTRKALLAARAFLETTHPGEVAALARRARAFDHLLSRIRLSPAALDDPPRGARGRRANCLPWCSCPGGSHACARHVTPSSSSATG